MTDHASARSSMHRRDFFKAAAVGALLPGASHGAPAAPPPPPQGRPARIATLCQAGLLRSTRDEGLAAMLDVLDRALEQKPDLVCLPENFATAGVGGKTAAEIAETLDGKTLTAARERARKHHCHIVCPSMLERDGRVFNSAIILDRDGRIAGIYDKACPVTTSYDYTVVEDGVTPGSPDIPVFDLDIGRIGIQICYDIGFAENWELLRRKGAQLVLWPSAYDGGTPLWTHAYLHHYYVVSSVRTGQSRIVDPCGAILDETKPDVPFILREVNLDHIVAHLDWNASIPEKIKAKYGDRVDVRRPDRGSAHFIVEPRDPALTTRALQEEFGFESSFQYHDRHRTAYADLRAGRKPAPQSARHGNRPEWGAF